MRVLVTGHHGYIGSVLASRVGKAGHDVVGLDTDYYRDCTLGFDRRDVPSIHKDIRDITEHDLQGFDAVVHLAALSNDPTGNLNPALTRGINLEATVRLATAARAAGVGRFLFSSSCIMYGLSDAPSVDEQSPLAPETEYARSKAEAEQALSAMAGPGFSPTFLRNGTVYGVSPRMRFDTVLNDLMGAAITEGRIVLYGDGTTWRPVVHIEDLSAAFVAALEAPLPAVHNQTYNVGADNLNVRIGELATAVAAIVPGCTVDITSQAGADRRSYRADFRKFGRTFPHVAFRTPQQGARDLQDDFAAVPLTRELYRDSRFIRLAQLTRLLEAGVLDANLTWATAGAAVQ